MKKFSPSETLQVLLDTHFPDKVRTEANNIDMFIGNNNNSKAIFDNINEESVRSAILSFKPYKSAGGVQKNDIPLLKPSISQSLNVTQYSILV